MEFWSKEFVHRFLNTKHPNFIYQTYVKAQKCNSKSVKVIFFGFFSFKTELIGTSLKSSYEKFCHLREPDLAKIKKIFMKKIGNMRQNEEIALHVITYNIKNSAWFNSKIIKDLNFKSVSVLHFIYGQVQKTTFRARH